MNRFHFKLKFVFVFCNVIQWNTIVPNVLIEIINQIDDHIINLKSIKYNNLFVASYSTTFPTAPVVAWFISSSAVKEPGVPVSNTAFVPLKVVALAADPLDSGSLISHLRL